MSNHCSGIRGESFGQVEPFSKETELQVDMILIVARWS